MSGLVDFIENDKGVHVLNPIMAEFTLCGDAFDAPYSEPDWEDGEFRETKSRTVTCSDCAKIIRGVRRVRIRGGTS